MLVSIVVTDVLVYNDATDVEWTSTAVQFTASGTVYDQWSRSQNVLQTIEVRLSFIPVYLSVVTRAFCLDSLTDFCLMNSN